MVTTEKITEHERAEDILLGSLGYGEDARIVSVIRTADGYRGTGRFGDGEEFEFECTEDLDDLQVWALQIIDNPKVEQRAR